LILEVEEAGNVVVFVELAQRVFRLRARKAQLGERGGPAVTAANRKIPLDQIA